MSNVGCERARALFEEDTGLQGDLLVLAEEVLRWRPILFAPPTAYQDPQLVVPARMPPYFFLFPVLSWILGVF